jgi:hypothetical protein
MQHVRLLLVQQPGLVVPLVRVSRLTWRPLSIGVLPPFRHEALAASVTTPQVAYFAIRFEYGSLRRNHGIRAYRASYCARLASHLAGFRNNLRPVILFHDQPHLSRGVDDIDDIPNALVSTITS